MTDTAADILVAGADASIAGGYFQVAPTTATGPVDASTALGTGWTNAGLITEDGVTVSESKSTEEIKDASGAVVRVVTTEYGVTVNLSLLAPTLKSFKLMRGDSNVTQDASGNIVTKFAKTDLPTQSWTIHFSDNGRRVRLYLPAGQITETSDIAYNVTSATTYEVTITCKPDANGVYAYEYRAGATSPETYSPDED